MKKIILCTLIFLFCMTSIALAEDTNSQEIVSNTDIYVTEDTTQWDIVKATNPNYDKIPSEVKEDMEGKYIEGDDCGFALYVSADFLKILSVVVLIVGVGIVVIWKKKK